MSAPALKWTCSLGHTRLAYECPACAEAVTGQAAPLENWRWFRGRTSSKRIKAQIDRGFASARLENRGKLSPDYVAEQIALAKKRLEAKKTAPKPQEAALAEADAGGKNGKAEGPGDESGQQELAEAAT